MPAMEVAISSSHVRRRPIALTGAQRLVLFATAMGGVATVLWLLPLHGAVRPAGVPAIAWWAELVACYAAALLSVRVRLARFSATLSLAEIPLAMGLFLVDPHLLLLCYAGGAFAAHATRRGLHPAKDFSNLMLDVLAVGVTVLVFTAIGADPAGPLAPRSIIALAVAMAASGWILVPLALNTGALLLQGSAHRVDYVRSLAAHALATATNTSIALMGLVFLQVRPVFVLLLIPPVLLVIAAQLAALESQQRADRMEFLFHTTDALHSTMRVDDRAAALLSRMIAMFGMSRAELVLVPDGRGAALRFTAGDGEEAPSISSSDLTYAEQEALNALRDHGMLSSRQWAKPQSAVSLLLAERGASFGTVVSLRGSERPQGMLLLLDPLHGDAPPGGREADLVLEVATQISVALENGQLAGAIRTMTQERDELRRHAFYDPLTQIANRPLFTDTVTRALAKLGTSRRPLAALFIDLDGFDAVNTAHGNPAGDEVLSAVAARLRLQIRKFDLVARLGGDQFGILLDGMRRRDDVHVVAQRIVETLRTPIPIGSTPVCISGSVGVAVVDDPASAPPADELLRRADMAMYLAKRQGKDRYVVFDTGARDPVIAAAQQVPPAPQPVSA